MAQSNNYQHYKNYLPQIYLPKLKNKISKPSTTSEVYRKSLHDTRTDYGNTNSHRVLTYLANEKHIYEVKPDPSYIYIQDPKLRQIVLMLLKSESQRASNNISPSILTQINHHDYSILFSKTGSIPIDNVVKEASPKVILETKQVQTDLKLDLNKSENFISETSVHTTSTQTDSFLYSIQNSFFKDSKKNEFYIAEIFDESTQKLSRYPFTMKLPSDLQRLIKNDLEMKPLYSGDRSYKIVINKNLSQSGQPPHVIRVLVRNTKELGLIDENGMEDSSKISSNSNNNVRSSDVSSKLSTQPNSTLPPIGDVSTVKYTTRNSIKNDYKVHMIKKEKKKVIIDEI